MLHLFANLWCRRKFLKSSKSEKTSASGNKQDHLHCVNYKNIYIFLASGQNPFLSNIKYAIVFAELPVKWDFDLGEP